MKLGKLLKYIDYLSDVVLVDNKIPVDMGEAAAILFKGAAMDIPWIYTTYKIVNDEESGTGAIGGCIYDGKPYVEILIEEAE